MPQTVPTLFDRPPAVRGSATSRAAADSIGPEADTLRRRVLAFLQARGLEGATDEEIQLGLGMNPSTQRPRRIELVEQGRVRDSGSTRRTRSNRRAVVWVTA